MDDNTGLNKVTSLKWLLLSGLQVARALAVCFPRRKGAGEVGVFGGKKTIHICCLLLIRGNKPIERNAVEWEEGEKIGVFLFLGGFFLQYCDALTLLLLGCSLLSLLAEPRSCCLPIGWWKADKSTPPPAKTARNPCGAGPAAPELAPRKRDRCLQLLLPFGAGLLLLLPRTR